MLVFALASCSVLFSEPPERSREFTAGVEIRLGEKHFAGTLRCSSPADMCLAFSQPEEISGFSVKTSPEGYICDTGGVSDLLPFDLSPQGSCASLFFETVKSAVFEPARLMPNADGNFSAVSENGTITAFFSPEGEPLKIAAPSNGLEIVFSAQ